MKTVSVYSAKNYLSCLIDEAAAGREIVIVRAGRPVAKLVVIGRRKKKLGILKGRLRVPADFGAPLTESAPGNRRMGVR